jgi:Fic family protein
LDQAGLDDLSSKNDKLVPLRHRYGLKPTDLYKKIDVEYTFNSNAIEGNPISLKYTEMILSGMVGGTVRSLKHVNDIKGHSEAFALVMDIASERNKIDVTNDKLALAVHKLVMHINHDLAGRYRCGDEFVSAGNRRLLLGMPDEIENLMKKLFFWISENESSVHPFLMATNVHYMLVRIHPFVDGNGRTARLVSNLLLMLCGYPPIIIPVERKKDYLSSLASWDDGDPVPFTKLMAELLHRMFAWYEDNLELLPRE